MHAGSPRSITSTMRPLFKSSVINLSAPPGSELSQPPVQSPVQQMMPRVANVFDQKIEAQGFDKIRSVIEIDVTDGRTIVQASDDRYRGGPEKPFTREELREKFTDCAQLTLGSAAIAKALDLIEGVERLKDVNELVKGL